MIDNIFMYKKTMNFIQDNDDGSTVFKAIKTQINDSNQYQKILMMAVNDYFDFQSLQINDLKLQMEEFELMKFCTNLRNILILAHQDCNTINKNIVSFNFPQSSSARQFLTCDISRMMQIALNVFHGLTKLGMN